MTLIYQRNLFPTLRVDNASSSSQSMGEKLVATWVSPLDGSLAFYSCTTPGQWGAAIVSLMLMKLSAPSKSGDKLLINPHEKSLVGIREGFYILTNSKNYYIFKPNKLIGVNCARNLERHQRFPTTRSF